MVLFRMLITPDGTGLVSRYTHDFKAYKDENGKTYMLDGGLSSGYYRRSNNGDEKFFEVTTDDKFEVIREYFERWNRYTQEYVALKDIDDVWLENILTWYIENNIQYGRIFRLFLEEKLYRVENEITVPADQNYIEYDY